MYFIISLNCSDMVCSVAGITSDANVLTNELRLIGQRYLFQYGDSIPCEQLVSSLCDVKQIYTQYGGKVFLLVKSINCLTMKCKLILLIAKYALSNVNLISF